jgi:glycosyltransferase involved in cell wall biosynthesis
MKRYKFMKKTNIGILTFPIGKSGNIPLSNLVNIVYSLSNDIYLITGNDGYSFFKDDKRIHAYGIKHESGASVFARILRYIYTQLKISYNLAKIRRNVDIWIFFIGGEGLLLPMLTARLLRTKVVLALAGFPTKGSQVQKDRTSKPTEFLSKINLIISNRIVVYSENIVKERGLEKYKNKVSIAKKHFLDLDKFKVKKQFAERKNTIGYIGSLHKIKGVLNFVHAIPKVLEKENEIKFVICGDGVLFNEIKEFISENKLNGKVKLTGWIPHDELPDYLNELKLVVLPSYTEGLPNLMLEAMACGTPVLATPVGAIPDVINDGETGFIMENNSPECIAKNVIRALKHPNLDKIVKNARLLVEREYTYEAAVERYREILGNLGQCKP